MKKLLILFGFLMLSAAVFGQDKKYNLPPNQILNPKAKVDKDYSFKLSELSTFEPNGFIDGDFLYEVSNEMENFKKNDLKTYDYYTNANNFYKSLSPKVKAVYSVDELWDIYIFDEKLTNKLKEIK
jgi:hypothetical protein